MFPSLMKMSPRRASHDKSEGAPLLYFIDVLESDSFINPITPIPSRVDKLFFEQSCGFFLPTQYPVVSIDDQNYSINFSLLYNKLIENFLFYARHVAGHMQKSLTVSNVEKWWAITSQSIPMIISYREDIDFILRAYLEGFKLFHSGTSEEESLLEYNNLLINYLNTKIEYNSIEVNYKQSSSYQKMFKVKDNYRYPNVVDYDNFEFYKKKTKRKNCVPIFVYDDLLECVLYNKQILNLRLNPDIQAEDINLNPEADLDNLKKTAEDAKLFSYQDLFDQNYIIPVDFTEKKIDLGVYSEWVYNIDIVTIYDQLDDLEYRRFLE